jgi:hypothetical protein
VSRPKTEDESDFVRHRDSNWTPEYLAPAQLVRLEGFEPPTLGSVDRCSNPLSYSRIDAGPLS